jgi:hypothetical protein
MSTCKRCGTTFHCAMADPGADGGSGPCWCTAMPPAVPVPSADDTDVTCWCPACLQRHIEQRQAAAGDASQP